MLREVPLATILRESVAVAGRVRVHRAQGDNTVPAEGKVLDFEVREYEYGSPEVAAEIQARLIESYDARSGAPLSDDVLRRVADIYRAAHAAGDPPTRTVMLAFNVSRSTAGRYVQRARERGFLGPTRQRVAAP
jgi:hypothetical protein